MVLKILRDTPKGIVGGRIVNWNLVTYIEKTTDRDIVIHFVDGTKIRDRRNLEDIWKLVQQIWEKK